MKLEYVWTRDDLKKELISKRYNTNLIFLIIGIIAYILFMYNAIVSELFDRLVILIGGLVFACFLMIVLYFTTKIYVMISLRKNDKDTNKAYGTYKVQLSDKSLKVTINDNQIEYNYQDIIKLKRKRHEFFICTQKDKLGLIFKEKVMGKDNYQQVFDIVSSKVNC